MQEIVLIYPIIRSNQTSAVEWHNLLDFFNHSSMSCLIVIDKTTSNIATKFFMHNFSQEDKDLFILPRNRQDTLFDSLGELILDENLWITQIHDGDDKWNGKIETSMLMDSRTVYFSDYYKYSSKNIKKKQEDFSMPNRIVFSLVPAKIWNKFSKLIQDQRFHVAGSFDFTLNFMAETFCNFQYFSGYNYYWNEENWVTRKIARSHLKRLARADGWEFFSSPEIANFNRTVDCLVSLNHLKEDLNIRVIHEKSKILIASLKIRKIRKYKYFCLIPLLKLAIKCNKHINKKTQYLKARVRAIENILHLYEFLIQVDSIESIRDLIALIRNLELLDEFPSLGIRFAVWIENLMELSTWIASDEK